MRLFRKLSNLIGQQTMNFIHNSRDIAYRFPFGAVKAGSAVELSVRAEDVPAHALAIDLRVWVDGRGRRFHVRRGEGVSKLYPDFPPDFRKREWL